MTATLTPDQTQPAKSRRGTNVRQRSAQVGVRLLPNEMDLLRQEAARQGESLAEVLRRTFLAAAG